MIFAIKMNEEKKSQYPEFLGLELTTICLALIYYTTIAVVPNCIVCDYSLYLHAKANLKNLP